MIRKHRAPSGNPRGAKRRSRPTNTTNKEGGGLKLKTPSEEFLLKSLISILEAAGAYGRADSTNLEKTAAKKSVHRTQLRSERLRRQVAKDKGGEMERNERSLGITRRTNGESSS